MIRKGSVLCDALLAIIVIAIAIMPLLGSVSFGYWVLFGSSQITAELNKFHDKIDDEIISCTHDGKALTKYKDSGRNIKALRGFTAAEVNVNIYEYKQTLLFEDRRVDVKSYILVKQ